MNQLDHCKSCQNRAVSRQQGIICGLTKAKPTFEDECPDYLADEVQLKRLERYNREFSPEKIHFEGAKRSLLSGIPLLLIGIFLIFLPLTTFASIIGGILVVAGLVAIVFAIVKFSAIKDEVNSGSSGSIHDDDFEVF